MPLHAFCMSFEYSKGRAFSCPRASGTATSLAAIAGNAALQKFWDFCVPGVLGKAGSISEEQELLFKPDPGQEKLFGHLSEQGGIPGDRLCQCLEPAARSLSVFRHLPATELPGIMSF